MTESATRTSPEPQAPPPALPFEPLPQFRPTSLQDDSALADCHGKRIGILIVTYNAVTTLTKVLKRITPNVWKNVEQVVVFDDASQDATFELAMGIKALMHLPKLHVLQHARNLGYGGNQKAGYQYFIEQGFDIVVLLHGDGQYAPEILSHMYSPIVRGEADAVFGSRMMKTYGGPIKGGMPAYKYVGNRILTAFENRAIGLNLTEFHSGYRAYNLHVLKRIDFTHMTNDFHFDTEIIIKLHHQNFSIKEVPIPTYYGSELCYVNGMRYAKDVFRAVRRYVSTVRSVRAYPEFQEYFVPCPVKRSRYSTHDYTRKLVASGNDVLEIGCGDGSLSAELAGRGNRVTAIAGETNGAPPAGVQQYAVADLDRPDTIPALETPRFDYILLLDILEHLKDPESMLEYCRGLTKERGMVIISVPNVAHLTVRWKLLFGKFNYADRGILDWTHLRFFTRKTIRRLVRQCGFEIARERTTVVPWERVLTWKPDGWVMRTLTRTTGLITRLLPGLFGYQVMLFVQPKKSR